MSEAASHRQPTGWRRQYCAAGSRAPADGYTLLMVATPHAVNVTLYEKSTIFTSSAGSSK
jgi:hypothetical protein